MVEQEYLGLSKQFAITVSRADNFHKDPNHVVFIKQYKSILSQLKDLSSKVTQLQLFSSNESVDDVSTENIKFLSVPYYLASFVGQYGGFGSGKSPDKHSRLATLLEADRQYLKFLHSLQDYSLLNKKQSHILDSFQNSSNPNLKELETGNPVTRRQEKIEAYKQEKAFKQALKIMQDDEAMESLDDEVVRKIYIDQLKYFALKSFKDIEGNLMEVTLLQNYIKYEGNTPKITEVASDDKARKDKFNKGYTDKVESINKPAIDSNGHVLRPFTIVPESMKRDQLQKSVQGTGQVLPTMTVEEFVDHELANGGMVAKSNTDNKKAEIKDNDYEAQDRETYKQREFDDFKDFHAKGSGNMKGNIG